MISRRFSFSFQSPMVAVLVSVALISSFGLHEVNVEHDHPHQHTHATDNLNISQYMHAADRKLFAFALPALVFFAGFVALFPQYFLVTIERTALNVVRTRRHRIYDITGTLFREGVLHPKIYG